MFQTIRRTTQRIIHMTGKADVLFDGSFEGLMCVVYARYYDKIEPITIRCFGDVAISQLHLADITSSGELLDEAVLSVTIETDYSKAERVFAALQKKTGEGAQNAYRAWLSPKKMYWELFNYVILCFKEGGNAENFKTRDYVLDVQKTASYVGREAHLLTGFCRFVETKTGVFYCDISPVNDVLPILAEHFCERFSEQPFVIHDVRRGTAVIYDTKNYIIQEVGKNAKFEFDAIEEQWQELWSAFHKTIANEQRVNKKLHRQMMPLRFRKHVTEYKYLAEIKEVGTLKKPQISGSSQQQLPLTE